MSPSFLVPDRPRPVRLSVVALLCLLVVIPFARGRAAERRGGTAAFQSPATVVSGTITENTTWTPAQSPYEISGLLTVAEGVTLTVEPGVVVRAAEAASMAVRGTLQAVGTASQPISFTGTTAQSGWWVGLYVDGSATTAAAATLDYVTIAGGGRSAGGATLYVEYATVNISHSTLSASSRDGLRAGPAGVVHIAGTTFTNNAQAAVVYQDIGVDPVLANLVATGNGLDAVVQTGMMSGNHVWENTGLPYVIRGHARLLPGGSLVVEPGVTVLAEEAVSFLVQGTLLAQGTATAPILFTGTAETPSHWNGITIDGSPTGLLTAELDHVTIAYGGRVAGGANLDVEYATVNLMHSNIMSSGNDGVRARDLGEVHVLETSFTDNANAALVYMDVGVNPVLAALSASGNGLDAVVLTGRMRGDHIWENTGLPYVIRGHAHVYPGGSLTIETGVVIRAEEAATFRVEGVLEAVGSVDLPISIGGTTAQPGWWAGLSIVGSPSLPAAATLAHVSIAHGGHYVRSANLYVEYATILATNSSFTASNRDGIRLNRPLGGSFVEKTSITGNSAYGVYNNTPAMPLVASNNWWGSASGPQLDDAACNSEGQGSRISSGVLFTPFLMAAGEEVGDIPLPPYARITLTPDRWFVPADGITRAVVEVLVHDKDGRVLPGAQVALTAFFGTVEPKTGTTDLEGRFLATLRASEPGEAVVLGAPAGDDCDAALPSETRVTFTAFDDAGELMPGAKAPYLDGRIEVEPEPIVRGVPTTASVRLTNDNDFPIVVNGSFNFLQSGIGQRTGPIEQVEGIIIAAKSDKIITTTWTPDVTGHYCLRFEYAWAVAPAGNAGANAPDGVTAPASGRGSSQRNLQVYGGSMMGGGPGTPGAKNALSQARRATNMIGDGQMAVDIVTGPTSIVSGFIPGQLFSNILSFIFDGGGGIVCGYQGGGDCGGWDGPSLSVPVFGSLAEDPPSQEYETLVVIEPLVLPHVDAVRDGMPAARAEAINELIDAGGALTSYTVAAAVSFDRLNGAAQAESLVWGSAQARAYAYYIRLSAQTLFRAANAFDALAAQAESEGFTDLRVTAGTYREYQQRLATSGFTTTEVEAAHLAGLPDGTIEKIRQRRMALDPNAVAGSQLDAWRDVATYYRELGTSLYAVPFFSISGRAGQAPAAPALAAQDHDLAGIYTTSFEIVVGNPFDTVKTVDLQLRPVGMPWDWTATLSTNAVTLGPGEEVTVTIDVTPGFAATQGTTPAVAVEGYVEGELLSGVVLQVMVPFELEENGRQIYLPAVMQH